MTAASQCERDTTRICDTNDNAAVDIALAYFSRQYESCETSELTRGMTDAESISWLGYLTEYTTAMAGCAGSEGSEVFGPANTQEVGHSHPPLGADDAAALIELYTDAFATELGLSPGQRTALENRLRTAAAPEIDEGISGTLSSCVDESLPAEGKPMQQMGDPELEQPSPGLRDADAGMDAEPHVPDSANSGTGGDPVAPPSLFPADWCSRLGEDEAFDIAFAYYTVQFDSCETKLLTQGMSGDQEGRWFGYLMDYTSAMAGCMSSAPLEGGIDVFGPANTDVATFSRPDIGRDDAALLIEQYLSVFAATLELTEAERRDVELHLWATAESEIDPEAWSVLSACESPGMVEN